MTPGAPGYTDAFVSKLSADGTTLLYSTFIGGSSNDYAYKIALDSSNNAYITGVTMSSDFPLINAYQNTFGGGIDAFISKLSADGSTLVYSTYLGGSENEEGYDIAVDSLWNAYITGMTESTDFPHTADCIQANLKGSRDAFVSKLSVDGSTLMYSTYLGGSSDENANQLLGTDYGFGFGGIAVDNSGNAYVTGSTASNDFPTTTGAFQTTRGGSFDAFACKLSTDGKTLDYSTYLGGSDVEYNYDIAIDSSGNAYITGHTESGNFPTSSGAFQTTMAGSEDAFISKISADGTSLVYSTYLGGSSGEYGLDIAVNSSGNAYLTGSTVSSDFPLANSIQENRGGGVDAFVSKLSADGTSLAYSTFLGGLNLDQGKGIVIDDSGNAYVTGKTASYDFPRVAGSYDVTFNRGVNDAFIAKLSDDVVPPPATLPTVTTQAVTGIGTTSATGNGNITDLGSPNPTQHGLCWNTTGTPTTADSATTEGAASATGAFASNITGLSPGITYYVRAYATNTEGTAYGSVVSFTTSAVQPPPVNAPPTVTTQAVTGIGTNLATGHGNITDLGSPDPSQYGVCWNTTGTPTIADSNTTQGAANATGAFTSNITGLSPNTTYYVRAYAINTEGTAYGNQVSFTTAAYMAAPVSVPTMNEWGMILFSLLIAGVFLWFIRRQNKKSC